MNQNVLFMLVERGAETDRGKEKSKERETGGEANRWRERTDRRVLMPAASQLFRLWRRNMRGRGRRDLNTHTHTQFSIELVCGAL